MKNPNMKVSCPHGRYVDRDKPLVSYVFSNSVLKKGVLLVLTHSF